jgi:hypothetical protein
MAGYQIHIDNEDVQGSIKPEGNDVQFTIYNRQRHLEWMSLDKSRVWSGASGHVPWRKYVQGMMQLAKTGECDMNSGDLHVHIKLNEEKMVSEIRLSDKYNRTAAAERENLWIRFGGYVNLEMLQAIA